MFNQKFSQNQFVMIAVSLAFWWLMLRSLPLAIGLFGLILIHELGHMWAAKYKGLAVSIPTFTPLGGQVQIEGTRTAAEEAFVKIAGPVVGGLAALVTLLVGSLFGSHLLIQVAMMGFALNLFNLIPLDPFDGGGITQAISRWFWIPGVVLFCGFTVALVLGNPINAIIAFFFGHQIYRAFVARREERVQRFWYFHTSPADKVTIMVLYLALAAAFVWLLGDCNAISLFFAH